jgi:diguanylate cyclase (GGDEF)-like protein
MTEADSDFAKEISLAQCRAALAHVPTALGSSSTLMLSLSALLYLKNAPAWLPFWLAAGIGMAVLRAVRYSRWIRRGIDETSVDSVLRELRYGAIANGLLWGIVPVIGFGQFDSTETAFTVFVLAGSASVALTQSLAYAPAGILFFLPVLVPTALSLFATGSPAATVVGINVGLLSVMMTRQALRTTREFHHSETLRLDALAMAGSLAKANARLAHLAERDDLTGLANRAALRAALTSRIELATKAGRPLALVVVDLDHFKDVNDTQGHVVGDTVLAEAARRFADLAGEDDFIARLGGDEFALVVSGDDAEAMARHRAEAMRAAMMVPVLVAGRRSTLGASVGVAFHPEHARSPIELFAAADIALYEAKHQGRNRVVLFDTALRQQLERRQRIESDLAAAIAEDRLDVHFQPQVDLGTGAVIGHEALVRWRHPQLGPVSPPDVVAAAQNTNISDRLTAFVTRRACRFLASLAATGDAISCVAINVSPAEFCTGSPAAVILEAIAAEGADVRRFEIEITEESMLDLARAEADLEAFSRAGLALAIDDFGAGQFSLANFSRLPIGRVKIDRSFITGIDANERHQAVVGMILALARRLDIKVLAEGIETEAEAATLARLGCSEAQGYLFGRPEPAERLLAERATSLAKVRGAL